MKHTILIIEDNTQNMYLATYILEQHGCVAVPAMDGMQGIKLAKELCPDLILLDIQLPVMDGFTVLSELRSVSALSHVPIIAVTSYAMVGDRERIMQAGCNGYIEKPIDPDTFMDEIQKYLPHTTPA